MAHGDNPCRSFFDKHTDNNDKVKELVKEVAPDWEQLSASAHSPGVVEHGEQLARVLFHPHFVDPISGELKPNVASDVKSRGASCDRLSHCTLDDALARARTRTDKKNAERHAAAVSSGKEFVAHNVAGAAVVNVHEVRAILEGGTKMLGVFDTGQAENAAHADICQVDLDGERGRDARFELFKLFKRGQVAT